MIDEQELIDFTPSHNSRKRKKSIDAETVKRQRQISRGAERYADARVDEAKCSSQASARSDVSKIPSYEAALLDLEEEIQTYVNLHLKMVAHLHVKDGSQRYGTETQHLVRTQETETGTQTHTDLKPETPEFVETETHTDLKAETPAFLETETQTHTDLKAETPASVETETQTHVTTQETETQTELESKTPTVAETETETETWSASEQLRASQAAYIEYLLEAQKDVVSSGYANPFRMIGVSRPTDTSELRDIKRHVLLILHPDKLVDSTKKEEATKAFVLFVENMHETCAILSRNAASFIPVMQTPAAPWQMKYGRVELRSESYLKPVLTRTSPLRTLHVKRQFLFTREHHLYLDLDLNPFPFNHQTTSPLLVCYMTDPWIVDADTTPLKPKAKHFYVFSIPIGLSTNRFRLCFLRYPINQFNVKIAYSLAYEFYDLKSLRSLSTRAGGVLEVQMERPPITWVLNA